MAAVEDGSSSLDGSRFTQASLPCICILFSGFWLKDHYIAGPGSLSVWDDLRKFNQAALPD